MNEWSEEEGALFSRCAFREGTCRHETSLLVLWVSNQLPHAIVSNHGLVG